MAGGGICSTVRVLKFLPLIYAETQCLGERMSGNGRRNFKMMYDTVLID